MHLQCHVNVIDSEAVCRVSIYSSIPFSPTFPGLRATSDMFCLVSITAVTAVYLLLFVHAVIACNVIKHQLAGNCFITGLVNCVFCHFRCVCTC